VSGNIALGGTLSPKFLLGVSTNGWTKSESGSSLTVATVTAAVLRTETFREARCCVFRDPRVLRR